MSAGTEQQQQQPDSGYGDRLQQQVQVQCCAGAVPLGSLQEEHLCVFFFVFVLVYISACLGGTEILCLLACAAPLPAYMWCMCQTMAFPKFVLFRWQAACCCA
jgi:hypothetical protein